MYLFVSCVSTVILQKIIEGGNLLNGKGLTRKMPETSYPLVSMRLTAEEVDELKEWALRYRYVDRRGPQPGAIARDLFREVLPLLRECDFDPERVKIALRGIAPQRKKGNQSH